MLLFNEVVEVGDRSECSEEVRPNCSLRETEDQVRCEEQSNANDLVMDKKKQ